MKRIFSVFAALVLTIAAGAQTLSVTTGSGTKSYSAADLTSSSPVTFSNGTVMTVGNDTYAISDITKAIITMSSTTDANTVNIVYSGSTATVTVSDNVADYVTATVSGAHVTINQTNTGAVDNDEITYVLSGTTTDGSLTLGGSYKCTVSLAGLTLTNPSGAAINITNSKRIQLSAKKGTENTLTDGSGSQKACIYSKGQLQLQGNGTLNVVGNYKHAIKSASYVEIKNLTLNVTSAVGDGINCEEYLLMKSGTVTISGVGDDGIQCDYGDATALTGVTTDHEDEDTGNIYIEGGTLTVTADATAAKCVKAEGDIIVSGGTVKVNAYGAIDLSDTTNPSYTAGLKADGNVTWSGGNITANVTGGAGRGIGCDGTFTAAADNTGTLTVTNSGATSSASSYHCTAKGVKAGTVVINGGTIGITMSGASAKGIKSDSDDGTGNMTITGGTLTVTTTGTGSYDQTEKDSKGAGCLKADNNMVISGGTLTLKSTGTGGKCIKVDGTLTVSGGTINATTTGGTYTSNNSNSQPKAIKSNGNMTVSGGSITASSAGHEAIETKGTLTVTDGTVYAYSAADDAINSASHMYLKGGTVTGISNGNDGIDSNGNLTISGGTVLACGAGEPECGLDAAEHYCLYITGGTVLGIGGGNNSVTSTTGSQCVVSTSGSVTAGSTVTLKSGSTTLATFTVPSNYSPTSGGRRAPGGNQNGGNQNGGFSYLMSHSSLTSGSDYTITIGSTSTSATASKTYSGR